SPPTARAIAMLVCPVCRSEGCLISRRSFLGFWDTRCGKCGAHERAPLTTAYRIAYWVILSLPLLRSLQLAREGTMAVPGGLGLLVMIGSALALVRDYRLRKK